MTNLDHMTRSRRQAQMAAAALAVYGMSDAQLIGGLISVIAWVEGSASASLDREGDGHTVAL